MAAELNGLRLPPAQWRALGQKGLTIAATANAVKTIRAHPAASQGQPASSFSK